MSETVTGYIDHIIFRNEENGYTVMVVKNSENEEELTCVGSFPAVSQGTTIQASGIYTHHPVYGKQFQISSFVEKIPEDTYAMERYLGSGAIKVLVQHWQPGLCADLARIPSGLWKRNRSDWLK